MEKYTLYDQEGNPIVATYYMTETEDGQVNLWYGTDPEHDSDPNKQFICTTYSLVMGQKIIDQFLQADRLEDAYGVTIWKVEDVYSLIDCTKEQALEVLQYADSGLETVQVERGWDSLAYTCGELFPELVEAKELQEDED